MGSVHSCNLARETKTSANGAAEEESVLTFPQFISPDVSVATSVLESNMRDSGLCPSCQKPFDIGKQRRLLDSCGHVRCYSCVFRQEGCSQENENLYFPLNPGSQRSSSHPRIVRPADPGHLYSTISASKEEATPPTMRLTASPRQSGSMASPRQPGTGRRSRNQRHSRRPQTVSVDDSTLSGKTLTSHTLL